MNIANDKNKDLPIEKKKKKKKITPFQKTLRIIGTVILSIILIMVITGSIVVTALTIYVMNFMETTNDTSLEDLQLSYSSFFYATDEDGNYTEICSITTGDKRIWVDIDVIPQHVQDVFVYSEDERFYSHDGVDFKRTFGAFANLVLHFWDTEQGASTITQQVVRMITGDNAAQGQEAIERKTREIFRAINLERSYTKTDILEAYLNVIYLNNNCYGVEASANFYFNKSVSELTLAEAASMAAMNKDPSKYDPFKNPDENKKRQQYILFQMYENGVISTDEYEAALAEKLNYIGYNKTGEDGSSLSSVNSYFEDSAIEEAIAIIMDLYGIDYAAAETRLKSGGFKVYTTVDLVMQDQLEAKFADLSTFTGNLNLAEYPEASGIIMDYSGNVLAVVGGVGEKTESRIRNRAVSAKRSPGSCIKPISSYGPAIMLDQITWSTRFKDEPLMEINGVPWPKNYSMNYSHNYNFAFQCLQRSLNTTAAQIIETITPRTSFDFLTQKLHFTTLIEKEARDVDGVTRVYSDIDRSPMAVGALTDGMTLEELVASYQMFGNLGQYFAPTFITMITDAEGTVIYQHKYISQQVMDDASAYVMNRMMRNVVSTQPGTGVSAGIGLTVDLIGKTGTAQNWNDLLFVGCTPNYISGIWYGYDTPKTMNPNPFYSSAKVWNNVFKEIVNQGATPTFTQSQNVSQLHFCTETGLIANESCPKSAAPGYYKKTNIPALCTINHSHGDDAHNDNSSTTD